VTCTFTNTKRARVTITKATAPAGLNHDFGFHTAGDTAADLGTTFTLNAATDPSIAHNVRPGTYTVTEDDPSDDGFKLTGLACEETTGNGDTTVSSEADRASERMATVNAQAGEVITCTYTNKQLVPRSLVVKSGTEYAYHGDTLTYEFAVSNVGNTPLHDVVVTDDKCSPVSSDPVRKVNDGGDGTLDQVGADGVNPEQWIYSCSMPAPAHLDGEANPIVNTATVTAKDELGHAVPPATSQHQTVLLHPTVSIDKTGPETATAGTAVTYTLVITNTGDESFASSLVVVSDARCEAPPALVSVNGDGSAASFDPGDKWTYTCTVQTAVGETLVHKTTPTRRSPRRSWCCPRR
jgi:archaellum component FlaG (FlaF/FlaG flagellin family)